MSTTCCVPHALATATPQAMSVVERLRAVLAELLGVDDGPNLTWYIGLGLALLGGLGINSGANLIKLGHMRAICGGRETGRTTWWFGLTLFIIGNLANFTAGEAPSLPLSC